MREAFLLFEVPLAEVPSTQLVILSTVQLSKDLFKFCNIVIIIVLPSGETT